MEQEEKEIELRRWSGGGEPHTKPCMGREEPLDYAYRNFHEKNWLANIFNSVSPQKHFV